MKTKWIKWVKQHAVLLGPYFAFAVLPGGFVMAALFWFHQHHKKGV